jgi:fucose 4-O-acetylase-like acetyltransferase
VAGHTLQWPVVRPLVYSWHVPLFFFLAGYFWSRSRPLRTELNNRIRTLGLPYFSWFLLVAIVFVPLDATQQAVTAPRLLGQFYDGQLSAMPYTTVWFVSTLFAAVILLRLLWLLPRPVVWAIALAGVAAGVMFGDVLARTPLAIGSAFPCLIFLLLGNVARSLKPRITHPVLLAAPALVACAVLVFFGISAPVDIKQGDYGTPALSVAVAAVISFSLVLLAEALFHRLPAFVHRAATRLSFAAFTVVLLHPLVMWFMLKFAPPVCDAVVFAAAMIIPWLVGILALRVRFSLLLTGVSRDMVSTARAGVPPARDPVHSLSGPPQGTSPPGSNHA